MRLHINVDHVATVRNARGTFYPDPVQAAKACLAAGAHGITAHLREDRRHIRDDDVVRLREAFRATLNLEMAATDEMVAVACRVHPDVVTLVPERREEQTTEGGLDVAGAGEGLRRCVRELQKHAIRISLFIDPERAQVEAARALDVQQIELHTGEYAAAPQRLRDVELERLRSAAVFGHTAGLEVAAGHGLTKVNVPDLARILAIVELNIGHAVVADAIFVGMEGAVRAMLAAIESGRPSS